MRKLSQFEREHVHGNDHKYEAIYAITLVLFIPYFYFQI